MNRLSYIFLLSFVSFSGAFAQHDNFGVADPAGRTVMIVSGPPENLHNPWYQASRAPLLADRFSKLPIAAIHPGGWLRKQMELQRDGLTGHLGEISIWLSKKDNAWLNKDGKGKYGWEELPYWLKGYADIGYMLKDSAMIAEAKFWIGTVLDNQRADGDFGPVVEHDGNRDLWTNMPMLWCLQSYYDYSHDPRVIEFMRKYFRWELAVPDEHFLKDYWENSRGGDNLLSVYWLYDRTGDAWLLDLTTKIDRNTANWRQKDNLPNWHNVNIAQCFREPATFYRQSHLRTDLDASYQDFRLVRQRYGQVPGGMFGADENARKGYDDPRQAVETCGMVEQMTSDEFLLRSTGDPAWADNCEDVAFNTFPAAFMPDYRSLRYLTAPNMVVSDGKNHAPGIANEGPFLMMNPFSSRCCQHNHAAGWVYFAENSWVATPDGGLAVPLYSEGWVTAKVGETGVNIGMDKETRVNEKGKAIKSMHGAGKGEAGGQEVTLKEETKYPFSESIEFTVQTNKPVSFPLYLRIPGWCAHPAVAVNGKDMTPGALTSGAGAAGGVATGTMTAGAVTAGVVATGTTTAGAVAAGSYIKISGKWRNGDRISLRLPMKLRVRRWDSNKNSVSVFYGPLAFSLKIDERYVQKDSKETAINDSRWQESADASRWPSYEIYANSPWNYGLLLKDGGDRGINDVTNGVAGDASNLAAFFTLRKNAWPADNNPFTNEHAPITISARGRQIPGWMIDQYGLCGVLPVSPVSSDQPDTVLTLVPMGGARLRISAFPVVKQ